ncbi:predicted protein [Nematostella vectensis]|uniref:G-protein coupled receptors family 1 profile domain-containing protein n=1 Tax=Nematostella vectensis TaxID=45351 RepID=A7RKC5_NEMVE|nr:predicted protein [Nematostella vectensis]|eukprot:XP_001640290.1 predicted protein [Nematostella vectensis]
MTSVNISNFTNSTFPPGPQFDYGPAFLGSGIALAIISPVTIVLNSLLLLTIFRDPFKTFHSPSAVFLVGLALTDLLTGLVLEPLALTCYFFGYYKHPHWQSMCPEIWQKIGILSIAVNNSSFLIVLAFTVVQYLAVSWPLKSRVITIQRSVFCIVLIWAYTVLFAMLREIGVRKELVELLDLFLHSTTVLVMMVVFYVLLHRAFSRKCKRGYILRAESSMQHDANTEGARRQSKHLDTERRFVRINLLLVLLLLFCAVPNTIVWYIYLFNENLRNHPKLFLVRIIVDNALWLKFMLDPVVYAWRLPKYRKALKSSMSMMRK